MRNRSGIITFTVIITLLCLYYLSFTFVSMGVQRDANEYARMSNGGVDYNKKQKYLDSMWNVPVYNLGFTQFTYKEVKESELHLGLDLQGGMHVIMEVSPVEILMALSNHSTDPNFLKAIDNAKKLQSQSQADFTTLFFREYQSLAGANQLAKVFANPANQGRIDFKTSEVEIQRIISKEVEDAVDRSYRIIKTRIDKFGVNQPNIQRIPGTGRIQVELPGVDNPERVRKLLQGVAKLEFWEVWEANEYAPFLSKVNDFLVKQDKAKKSVAGSVLQPDTTATAGLQNTPKDTLKSGDPQAVVANEPKTAEDSLRDALAQGKKGTDTSATATPEASVLLSKLVRFNDMGGFELVYSAGDTAAITAALNREDVRPLLPSNMQFAWSVKPFGENEGKAFYQLYVLKKSRTGKAPLTGEVVIDASQGFDERGNPDVAMQMNPEGAKKWKKVTGANVNKQIAIVLDNYVYSAPVVQNEIAGGSSSITGKFTIEEARDLANILKAGKLPAPTRIVEEAVVGPSLGKEAIQQGLVSSLVGLGLVILFMIVYYARAGMVANVALLINVFFIIGILAQMDASLTLPGIAGMVLTFGMSVDANVLIYERVREELRNGLSMTEAIRLGYDRAFSSIFDSNVTTLLTGLFLYIFGTGPIKGFAVTLIIGIICSFFTAVYISKVIISYWVERGDASKLSFSIPATEKLFTGINYNFMAKRRIAYVFSAIFIGIGMTLLIVQGPNWGVDFKGGRTYVVGFNQAIAASDIRSALTDDFKGQGIEVKTYGSDDKVKITTGYKVEDEAETVDAEVLAILNKGLKDYTDSKGLKTFDDGSNDKYKILSNAKVGATIADDIRQSSLASIFFSLLAIFFYILVRFKKWQFGFGAVVALFHDTLIVISVFAILRAVGISFEIDQIFVAAILTIIGYSINDTVVVFDRVREFLNMNVGKGESIEATINDSINNTLSRTLITAVATFMVLIVLFIAGGEVLRGFSLAMLIGLFFGTYSSVFVATSIVVDTLKAYTPTADDTKEEKPTISPARA